MNSYEVVLKNKYYLRELIESITLEDSIDEIAYRATVQLKVTDELAQVGIAPGDAIRVSGIPYGGSSMVYLLHPGVVWECDSKASSGTKHIEVTIYDKTIYLDKSEDEYLFASGTTVSQRIKQYCNDWGIPISNIPETGVQLSKAVYRAQSIYSMIQSDIKETAQKGGKLYKRSILAAELYEISPVAFPASPANEVSVRSLDEFRESQNTKRSLEIEKEKLLIELDLLG